MVSESQDPVSEIEQALVRMRRDQSRGHLHRRPDHEQAGPPWRGDRMPVRTPESHPAEGERLHQRGWGDPGQGRAHPHDRSLGGAARFRLLDALRVAQAAGRSLSISEVAVAISVDQPRASRLVNEAADRGLVTRRPDERDARRSVVQLSDAGRALLETAVATRRSAVTHAVAGFTPEETATFAALLTRFVAAWPR